MSKISSGTRLWNSYIFCGCGSETDTPVKMNSSNDALFPRAFQEEHLRMKRLFPLLMMICLLTTSFAQQKSARDYYEEARKAGSLPSLPYVCFRTTTGTSRNQEETKDDYPTFAMLGSSKQIADIIKSKDYGRMNDADREKLRSLRDSDYLYIQGVSFRQACVTAAKWRC